MCDTGVHEPAICGERCFPGLGRRGDRGVIGTAAVEEHLVLGADAGGVGVDLVDSFRPVLNEEASELLAARRDGGRGGEQVAA